MIRTFAGKGMVGIWAEEMPKDFPSELAKLSRRKMRGLAAAVRLGELRQHPANRLAALVGNRVGRHSIRVNDQWRLCFVWRDGDAWDVEIVDYHGS